MSDGNVTDEISGHVIGAAMTVHSTLGSGFTEAVYQNALAIEMAREGTPFEREVKLEVRYRGELIRHYLAATQLETALLLNFGSRSLQIKKKFRTSRLP